jgi:hypothetical protein
VLTGTGCRVGDGVPDVVVDGTSGVVSMVIILMVVMDGSVEGVGVDEEGGIAAEDVLETEAVDAEEGGGLSAVVVGAGAGVPPGVVGIVGGASVVGTCPAGTNTVVVTKTVVTALGAANAVEKTVSVTVPKTTLRLSTVVRTSAVTVDVTV